MTVVKVFVHYELWVNVKVAIFFLCMRITALSKALISYINTVPLKGKLPPSRETRLVSRETRLERNETRLVSRECTGSANTRKD